MTRLSRRISDLNAMSLDLKSKVKMIWYSMLFSCYIRMGNWGRSKLIKGKRLTLSVQVNDKTKVIILRTQDMPILSEILVNRVYLPTNSSLRKGHIIDLGANIGLTSILFACHYPDHPLIAVEPSRKNLTYLQENLELIHNCVVLHAAIDHRDRTVGLHDSGLGYNSTITESNFDYQVRAISLDTIIKSNQIKKISLLKCDIEGAEEFIFNENASSWLHIVDNVAIEIHRQAFIPTITEILDNNGLSFSSKTNSVYWFCRKNQNSDS